MAQCGPSSLRLDINIEFFCLGLRVASTCLALARRHGRRRRLDVRKYVCRRERARARTMCRLADWTVSTTTPATRTGHKRKLKLITTRRTWEKRNDIYLTGGGGGGGNAGGGGASPPSSSHCVCVRKLSTTDHPPSQHPVLPPLEISI